MNFMGFLQIIINVIKTRPKRVFRSDAEQLTRAHRKVIHPGSGCTSIKDLGSSLARNSCSMQSRMFFQPSRRMSPWRCARPNTVRAANCALKLLPKVAGMFSGLCNVLVTVSIICWYNTCLPHAHTQRNREREREGRDRDRVTDTDRWRDKDLFILNIHDNTSLPYPTQIQTMLQEPSPPPFHTPSSQLITWNKTENMLIPCFALPPKHWAKWWICTEISQGCQTHHSCCCEQKSWHISCNNKTHNLHSAGTWFTLGTHLVATDTLYTHKTHGLHSADAQFTLKRCMPCTQQIQSLYWKDARFTLNRHMIYAQTLHPS